jgi:hypothetical protein
MKITISKMGSIEIEYENSQGSSQVDEYFVFPSYAYAFRIRDAITTIHIEISSLNIEHTSTSVSTSVQSTVFLDKNRRYRHRKASIDENKYFHAAVMGQHIDQTVSTHTHTNGGIIFTRLRLMQE